MNHDELLADIDMTFNTIGGSNRYAEKAVMGLRAVVELHKPFEPIGVCSVCRNESEYFVQRMVEYPCPTIQAIEKELN